MNPYKLEPFSKEVTMMTDDEVNNFINEKINDELLKILDVIASDLNRRSCFETELTENKRYYFEPTDRTEALIDVIKNMEPFLQDRNIEFCMTNIGNRYRYYFKEIKE